MNEQQSLFNQEPNSHEQKLIHDIFVKSIDMKHITFNQRILPAGSVWMEDGAMSNIIFSHPEDRNFYNFLFERIDALIVILTGNAHNTVFGGFLMRNALELSWALAYQYR